MASRNKSRNRGKRPTATIDLKAKDVSEKDTSPKVDASKVLARGAETSASDKDAGASKPAASSSKPTAAADAPQSDAPKPTGPQSSGPKSSTATGTQQSAKSSGNPNVKTSAPKSASTTSARSSGPDASAKKSDKSSGGGIGSVVTHLLAGGLGGVLAFFGASTFAPGQGGDATGPQGAAVSTDALEARLAALETREPATAKVEIPKDLTDRISNLESLNTTIATLTEQQGKLTSDSATLASEVKALADPAGGGATELRQRLDSMENTIASLGKAAEGSDGKAIPKLAALAGRMNDMRTEIEAKIVAAQQSVQADVEKRVTAVDAALKATANDKSGTAELLETLKGGNQRLSLGLETARTETARIVKDVTALRAANELTTTALNGLKQSATAVTERLSSLEDQTKQSLSALPGQSDIAAAVSPVTDKLSALESQVSGVMEREADRAASAKNVLLSIELANLQRALDQGRPIADEIINLQANAPAGMDLSALDNLASNTVVSQDALTREFSGAASVALQSENLDENAGTFDKLLASARSIVRVRKTGDVEGNTTEAVIARAEDNLQRSDLSAAVKELAALDDKAASGMAAWLAKARDRLAVDAALAKIEAGLKASVSSSATN